MSKVSSVNPLDEPEENLMVAKTLVLWEELDAVIKKAQATKPNDRSAVDRHWAVFITQLEQAQSTFFTRIFIADSAEQRAKRGFNE